MKPQRGRAPSRHGRNQGPRQRQLRVGEEVRHALARLLDRGELRDPVLLDAAITVSEVRMTPDLRAATAFVMPLGGRNIENVLAALHRAAPYLKGRVAREVSLRFVPELRFEEDRSFVAAHRVGELLQSPEVARDLAIENETPETGKRRRAKSAKVRADDG